MSEHHALIEWKNNDSDFSYAVYDRTHTWKFHSGIPLYASAAAQFHGNPQLLNPEEAFVAALSSCHMLTFLAIASRRRLVVDSYTDHAIGYLEKNDQGKLWVSRVILDPVIKFKGENVPGEDELNQMHASSHKECFIANSMLTRVSLKSNGAG